MTPSYTGVYDTGTLLPGACYLLCSAIEEIEYQLVELARSLDLRPLPAVREDVQVGVVDQPEQFQRGLHRDDLVLAALDYERLLR